MRISPRGWSLPCVVNVGSARERIKEEIVSSMRVTVVHGGQYMKSHSSVSDPSQPCGIHHGLRKSWFWSSFEM